MKVNELFHSIASCFCGSTSSVESLKTDLTQIQKFKKDFSWDAYFSPHGSPLADLALRRYRTDMEPDDVLAFMKMLLSLDGYLAAHRGPAPTINVILSEGSKETIEKKALTLKITLCRLVADGLVTPKALNAFAFFADAPRAKDANREIGYENVHQAALQLVDARVKALLQTLGETAPVAQHYETCRKDAVAIREFSIAPINNFMEYYGAHPELLPLVDATFYGSFNFLEAIERGESPEKVQSLLGACHKVFNFEAFLATRSPDRKEGQIARNEKGDFQWNDLNKVGAKSHAEVFAPLFAPDASPLQQFLVNCWKGWSRPTLDKMLADLKKAIPQGDAFVAALTARIDTLSQADALNLFRTYLPVDKTEDELKAILSKCETKVKIAYAILSNKEVQGTLSDLLIAFLFDNPSLIDERSLTLSDLTLQKQSGRLNTVFAPNPQGNAWAIQSSYTEEQDIPGIDRDRMLKTLHDFFQSLQPRPLPRCLRC